MNFVDTHSHHYSDEFILDLDASIQRAKDAGVVKILLPNIDSQSLEPMFNLCDKDLIFSPMLGFHPTSVKENYKKELENIQKLLNKKPISAIGEIGIDLYWDKTFVEEQIKVFETQIQWALNDKLPIVIHMRKSFDLIYNSLMKFKNDIRLENNKFQGVFHCFGGDLRQANKIVELGFKLGIGGVITFKNAGLAEVVKHIDIENLLLETDSPYLSPEPYRGKRNESSYIPLIAQKIAEIKGISIEDIAKITSKNANKIFSLGLNLD